MRAARVPARLALLVAGSLVGSAVLAGCAEQGSDVGSGESTEAPRVEADRESSSPASDEPAEPQQSGEPEEPAPAGPEPSDGTPRRATLGIPRIGLTDLAVVPYRGFTDDAPGTEIQDGGVAASPFGPRGGTGPGGIGNYQVTAHRLSSTQAFLDLPALRRGDRVTVQADGVRYVYEIVDTRETSFRSPASLRAQRAAVPGRPGVEPTRAMITLSTCATPEDRAEGNYWSDEFGNPEHRIDKIGVLRRTVELS
jgi:sortase A